MPNFYNMKVSEVVEKYGEQAMIDYLNAALEKAQHECVNELPELPPDTPCMVSDEGRNWLLRYYEKGSAVFCEGLKEQDDAISIVYKYVIPCNKFDFEHPDSNVHSLYNYGLIKP